MVCRKNFHLAAPLITSVATSYDQEPKDLTTKIRERSDSVNIILNSDGKVSADIQSIVSADAHIKLTGSHDIAEVASLVTNF